jgi:outer membrane protein assembly factor BamB
VVGLAVLYTTAAGGDWPNFRGPKHDGISPETGLKTTWPTPPKAVWEAKVGDAFSGISIVGDRAFTCGTSSKKQTVVCLDAGSGKLIWQTPIEDAYFEPMGGNGPRSTPTIGDDRVYVLGAQGRLVCLNATDGKRVWEKKFGGVPQWGYSGSVLIEGSMAVVSAGGADGALVAYDKSTGAQVWKSGDDKAGYATPYPFTFEGERYIVGFTATKASVVRAKDGVLAWETDWKTDWDVNAASPIFDNGHLFLSSGYKTGSAVYKLSRAGEKLKADNVWGGIKQVLLGKFQSAVLHDGHLYCSDEKRLACVEFLAGKQVWEVKRIDDGPRPKDSTLVLAEGHLFIQIENGDFVITPATPEGYKPTAEFKTFDGKCWTVPTLANGRMYVRDMSTLKCFNMKE